MITRRDDQKKSVREYMRGGREFVQLTALSRELPEHARLFSVLRLIPGASIGMHTHEDSCEVIYVLSGTASFVFNGEPETVEAGQAHYCPKGGTHTMKNNGDCDLVFLAVVPKQ